MQTAAQHRPECLHIVTVGASILTNCGWQKGQPLPRVRDLRAKLNAQPRKLSAELNALIPFLDRGQCTHVHLIATKTPESDRCLHVLQRFLQERRLQLTRATIAGLFSPPADAPTASQRFYNAMAAFRSAVLRISNRARARGQRVLINATGGLKAEVAFAILVAADLGIEAYYLHESMAEPVILPTRRPTPGDLDHLRRQRAARWKPVLSECTLERLAVEALLTFNKRDDGRIGNVRVTDLAAFYLDTAPATREE